MNVLIILSIVYHSKLLYQLEFSKTPIVQMSISTYLEGLILIAVASIVISNILSILIIRFRLESDFLWFISNANEKDLGSYAKEEWIDYFLVYFIKGILLIISLALLYAIAPKII